MCESTMMTSFEMCVGKSKLEWIGDVVEQNMPEHVIEYCVSSRNCVVEYRVVEQSSIG